MADDIIARLRCPYTAASESLCEECAFCAARAEIERLRALGDALADAAIRQQWSRLDVAVAAWQEARRG